MFDKCAKIYQKNIFTSVCRNWKVATEHSDNGLQIQLENCPWSGDRRVRRRHPVSMLSVMAKQAMMFLWPN